MPRRNRNVRDRNTPAAAQRQPRSTVRTQFDARSDRAYSRQPTLEERVQAEIALYAKASDQLGS